jgi:deoxyribonuclease V
MNVRDLKKEQLKRAKKVIVKDDFDEMNYIGGCDQAFVDNQVISAVVVLDAKTLKLIEKKYAVAEAPIQYIPGFLSYRESPAVVEAVSKLQQKPDLMMVDANGILHPRKIGMASHLGILLDMPTIGIAKKLLMGEEKDGKIIVEGETRAIALKTKEHAKPIYVSPGHRVSLKTAAELVKKCLVEKHKMPEPLHEAHKYSNKVRERMLAKEEEKEE